VNLRRIRIITISGEPCQVTIHRATDLTKQLSSDFQLRQLSRPASYESITYLGQSGISMMRLRMRQSEVDTQPQQSYVIWHRDSGMARLYIVVVSEDLHTQSEVHVIRGNPRLHRPVR
jgi:hypothetical protein